MRTDDRGSRRRLAAWAPWLLALLLPAAAFAEGEGGLPSAHNDIENVASLQRGARNFMNYCSGCHSAQFVRYNRIGADLGIPDPDLRANLIFNPDAKLFDTIQSAMPVAEAKNWFGTVPPDLSLMARACGTDHIYNYLKSFSLDPSRPTGVNNTVLPGTAMPHVLANLQGLQQAVYHQATLKSEDGKEY